MGSLGKLDKALVAVGDERERNLVVELWEGGRWTRLEDFPNADFLSIFLYSTVTVEETMYLIGGKGHMNKVSLGRRSGSGISWSRGKNLLIPRDGHRSVVLGQSIFNVGGIGTFETESWEITDDAKRYRHQPVLDRFQYYPEIFVVDAEYCPSRASRLYIIATIIAIAIITIIAVIARFILEKNAAY